MSHAVLLMITNTSNPHAWDEMMEPYEEDAEPQYREKKIEYPAAERDKEMSRVLADARKLALEHPEDEKCKQELEWIEEMIRDKNYDEFAMDYHGYQQDEGGNWYYEHNPNARWDWWVVGGRWSNMIETKDGKEVDVAKVKDIEESCLKDLHTYAVLTKDGWYERSKLGWWAVSYIDKDSECMCAPEYIPAKDVEELEEDKWIGDKYKEKVLTHINHLYIRKDDGYELWEGVEVPSEVMEIDFFREVAWKQAFYERFIKDLDPETYLVVIDYHI